MHPRAKSMFGVGALFILCLSGVQTCPAAQVVLSDPLTSWPLNFGAQGDAVMLKGGAVHIVESDSAANWVTYPGFSLTDMDASLTITAQTATGNAAGLIFWATGLSDFFLFSVADLSGTFAVTRHLAAGGWQIIIPYMASAAIKSGVGAVNTLHIVTKGNSVALSINDQSIGNLALQAPAGGGTVGIEGEGQAGKPADYIFSNLSVSQ